MQDEHGATASSLVDTHGQAVGEGLSSSSGRRRGYSAHMIHPFCCVHLQSPLWEVFAGKSVRKNGMAPIIWYVVFGRQRGKRIAMLPKRYEHKGTQAKESRVPLCSVKRQRACLVRDHPDLLQQLQNVCTQPVFDDFPSFDAKEVHPRVLDAFSNRGRRSAWHATLIRAAKDPATSNQVFIGERTHRGRKALVAEGGHTPADPLLQPIGAAHLSRTRASGSKMRDEGWRDDLIRDGQIAIPYFNPAFQEFFIGL